MPAEGDVDSVPVYDEGDIETVEVPAESDIGTVPVGDSAPDTPSGNTGD